MDLVAEQIAIAEGRKLEMVQEDVHFRGHAVEFRINAEDPDHDFRPSPGTVTGALFPAGDGIRVDTHIETGSRVPPYYDSLLAKIVVQGADRRQALARAREALQNCRIEGVQTNLEIHRALLNDAAFVCGGVDTNWFERFHAKGRSHD